MLSSNNEGRSYPPWSPSARNAVPQNELRAPLFRWWKHPADLHASTKWGLVRPGDDLRTFLGEFVSCLPKLTFLLKGSRHCPVIRLHVQVTSAGAALHPLFGLYSNNVWSNFSKLRSASGQFQLRRGVVCELRGSLWQFAWPWRAEV